AVHLAVLRPLHLAKVAWDLERAGAAEAERDARRACVGHTGHPRWRWHAIDHHPGTVVASVCGRRTGAVFVRCQALLAPYGLTRSDTDDGGCLHASPRPRRALPRPTPHADHRAHTSDRPAAHETLGPQDHRLFAHDPDA